MNNNGKNSLNMKKILKKLYKRDEKKINNYLIQQQEDSIIFPEGHLSDNRNIKINKYILNKNNLDSIIRLNKLLYNNKHNSFTKYDKDKINLDLNSKGNIINNSLSVINKKYNRENNSTHMESVEWMYLNNIMLKNFFFEKENKMNKENINYFFPLNKFQYKNSIKKKYKFPNINNNNIRQTIKIEKNKIPVYKNKIIINAIDKEKKNFSEKKNFKEENKDDNIIKKRKILNYYFISSTGSHHNLKKINQDCYFILPKINGCENINIYGIINGHGPFGDKLILEIKNFFSDFFNNKNLFLLNKENKKQDLSLNLNYNNNNKNILSPYSENQKSFCKIHKIKLIIEKNNEKINDTYEILSRNNYMKIYESFNEINKKLHEKYDSNKNCDDSGSSLNLLIIFNTKKINKIISINLGNTKSILITDEKKIKELNISHTPCIKEERIRIEQNGGVIDRIDWLKVGPLRVWFKDKKYPGLTITRSLGDFEAIPLGIIHEPDIKEFDIDEEKIKIIVIATNSIWEFLTNDKIMDITWQYYDSKDTKAASEKIIEYANKIWKIKNPNNIPDLTVSVFFLSK